jgi:hypothetical protein
LDEDSRFHRKLGQFIEQSQVQVTHRLEQENITFHGSTGKDEGLRLFVITVYSGQGVQIER